MKRIFIFLLVCSCWQIFPVHADVLVPLNLFAEKSKDVTKEHVFVWNGDQYSCDSPSALYFKTEKEAKKLCAFCPNREVKRMSGGDKYGHLKINGKTYYSCENESCLNCSDEGWCGGDLGHAEVKDVYACVSKTIKKCPADKPQLDTFGVCHSCDEEENIDMSWDTTGERVGYENKDFSGSKGGDVCDNRSLIWVGKDVYSVLKNCSKESPLQDYKGKCHRCDDPSAIVVATGRRRLRNKEEEQVQNYCVPDKVSIPWQGEQDSVCPNRVDIEFGGRHRYYSVYSILQNCSTTMPLRDEDGGCHSCTEPKEIVQNEKAVAFLGEIRCGKIYNANSEVVGTVIAASPFARDKDGHSARLVALGVVTKESKKFSPSFGMEYVWDMYDMKNKKIGSVKAEYHSLCGGEEVCGSFSAKMYDLQGKLVAHGNGQQEGADPKNNKAIYYWENVSDKTCPNREMYRKNTEYRENVLVSRLKK